MTHRSGSALVGRNAPSHLATSRLPVEHAIHWAIEGGATPSYDDWENRLQETILRYLGESSWSVSSHTG